MGIRGGYGAGVLHLLRSQRGGVGCVPRPPQRSCRRKIRVSEIGVVVVLSFKLVLVANNFCRRGFSAKKVGSSPVRHGCHEEVRRSLDGPWSRRRPTPDGPGLWPSLLACLLLPPMLMSTVVVWLGPHAKEPIGEFAPSRPGPAQWCSRAAAVRLPRCGR